MEENISDRGFVSGFIGVGIHMTIQHILQHIYIASLCKEELANLRDLAMSIELIVMHIQHNRVAFKTGKDKDTPSAVNKWLNDLHGLLLQASKIVQWCSKPKSRLNFSGCKTKKKISSLNSDITEHLKLSPLLVRIPELQAGDTQKVLEGLGQIKDSVETLASCATTSQAAKKNLTVGEDKVLPNLKNLVIGDAAVKFVGVLGKDESGKALILQTLFNSQEVRNHFRDGLLLWLAVSQSPSYSSLRNDLRAQIEKAPQKNVNLEKNITEEEMKQWLNQTLQQSNRFVLFLDDIWGRNAKKLLTELGIVDAVNNHTESKVIVSSRDPTAMLDMGVEDKYIITIEDLVDLRGRMNLIEVPDIVGPKQAFEDLENFVINDAQPFKIGVVGKCGSGKTLLLKTLFNSQKVRTHFNDGLLLWLTLSQRPSVTSLMNDLCKQIALQKNLDLIKVEKKIWLNQQLQQSSRFVLVLDDVWGRNAADLLEGLGILGAVIDHTKYKVILSSRDPTALIEIGVAKEYTIAIQDLKEDESWELFKQHAFLYSNGNPSSHRDGAKEKLESDKSEGLPLALNEENPPANIDEEMAKSVCSKCEGVPLRIKVVARAMASSTHRQKWKWALDRLQNSPSLDDCLRLSYDALGNEDFNLQLCFLHVAAAFLQEEIIDVQEVIPLWMGEGLLAKKMLQYALAYILADHCLIEPMIRNTEGHQVCLRMQDPFEIGRLYVNLLAERCLIEPMVKDADGLVVCFRMLDVLRDSAIRIAKHEENFSCLLGNGFIAFQENESLERKRISLGRNKLSSLPQFRPPSSSQLCSLLISENIQLTKIPKKVIGSLMSLKVLDLSGTSALSLPENVGCLKQLVCLKLLGMPINRLPKSVRDLVHLEILDVSFTKIKELPCDIHMLRSLRYLGLRGCKYLQNLPYSISGLLSLQYLYMDGCRMWTKPTWNRYKKVASLQSIGDLAQLKKLALQNDWEAFKEGTLRSMTEMDTLLLILPNMESVPVDIKSMSKLRRLSFKCNKLTKMDSLKCYDLTETEVKMKIDVTKFEYLSYLKFYECSTLEIFEHLHALQNLRQLEIILCPNVKIFPRDFGEKGAFPLLETFSLVGLRSLEELPEIEKDAMSSLQRFNMMDCPKLKMLPDSYLNLKTSIRIYYCPMVVENLRRIQGRNMNYVEMVEAGEASINTEKIINKYLQVHQKKGEWLDGEVWCNEWLYGEFWCNELFQAIQGLMMTSI